jgi:hypothetical protein
MIDDVFICQSRLEVLNSDLCNALKHQRLNQQPLVNLYLVTY